MFPKPCNIVNDKLAPAEVEGSLGQDMRINVTLSLFTGLFVDIHTFVQSCYAGLSNVKMPTASPY